MRRKAWYEKREMIARRRERMEPILDFLGEAIERHVSTWPPDPLTNTKAVTVQQVEPGNHIRVSSPTGELTLTLPENGSAIELKPSIALSNGRNVTRIYGATYDANRQEHSLIVEKSDEGDDEGEDGVSVSLESIVDGIIDRVLI